MEVKMFDDLGLYQRSNEINAIGEKAVKNVQIENTIKGTYLHLYKNN